MSIPTNNGNQTPEAIIDECTYGCYAFNRDEGMSAEALLTLFPCNGAAMEQRYQQESRA